MPGMQTTPLQTLGSASAVEALRQSLANLAEVRANLRLLTAAIVDDHHQQLLQELDALDSIADVMRYTLEEFDSARKPLPTGTAGKLEI